MADGAFDLAKTYVHLGLGGSAVEVDDFSWSRAGMTTYLRRFASDGDDGRLVGISPMSRTWRQWERHVDGDELVLLLSGRIDVVRETEDGCETVTLTPGQAMLNRRGTWHTTDVIEPGESLFVVAGRQTEYRPRDRR